MLADVAALMCQTVEHDLTTGIIVPANFLASSGGTIIIVVMPPDLVRKLGCGIAGKNFTVALELCGDDRRRLLLRARAIGVLRQPDSAIEIEGLVPGVVPDRHACLRSVVKRGDERCTVGHDGSPKRQAPPICARRRDFKRLRRPPAPQATRRSLTRGVQGASQCLRMIAPI